MSVELALFIGVAALLTLLQAGTAQPVRGDTTVYQLADKPSWVIGGALAIAIAVWRPWFTTSWWKALIAAPALCLFMSSVAMIFIGRLASSHAVTSPAARIARMLSSLIVLAALFFGFRSCG
jgi:hypothetical protein